MTQISALIQKTKQLSNSVESRVHAVKLAQCFFYAVVCWSGGITERDKKRLDKMIKRASSICPLDSVEQVGEKRMWAKLSDILNNPSHPLYETVRALGSSFSQRLLHLW